MVIERREPYVSPALSSIALKAYSVVSRHQRTRLTYQQLDNQSNALARGLYSRGVKKGDRVAVSLGNNIEFATVREGSRMSVRT